MRRLFRLAVVILSLGVLVAAGAASATTSSQTYVVQPGDSLWAISQANGITVAQLAAANDINPNDILPIGRHLYIPPASSSTGSSNTGSSSTASSSSGSSSGSNQGSSGSNPWTFCSTFTPSSGPWGQFPQLLQETPSRLALEPLFERWAGYYNLSLPLLEAIAWQESGWQQNAVSSAGAIGTGQIMPATAAFISSTIIGQRMNIHSTNDNIRMSAAFLNYLADLEGNSRCMTIAAYYEGPLNLSQYGVFPETQAYVASVEALIPEFE
jgi:N-acetylmuramoyl-L-alanine amidase